MRNKANNKEEDATNPCHKTAWMVIKEDTNGTVDLEKKDKHF